MIVRPPSPWSALVLVALAACGDDAGPPEDPVVTVTVLELGTEAAARAELADLTIEVLEDGQPIPRLQLQLTAEHGGGAVTPKTLRTDDAGRATFSWTLGSLPVANVLSVETERGTFTSTIDVPTAGPLNPGSYSSVDAFLTAEEITGSTEDLAFRAADDTIVMGIPGGLIAISDDGGVSRLVTTGVALARPLGLAFDQAGRLWIADGDADALVVMDAQNRVETVATDDGGTPFIAPNDVAVGPDGRVYMSDTCTGKVYAFDEGNIVTRASFDRATEGGPNGLVVGPDGALWVTTENVGLFCDNAGVTITDNVAGLFRLPIEGDTFGPRQDIATNVALFGDGLAFDAGGNLYVLFDTNLELALDETILYVLPKGATTLRRVFAAKNKVWANVAFGGEAHGDTTLYLSLLAVPPFTTARGLERVRVEVTGAPLPPE